MARITIEDCMEKVPNRFHLVQMASIRAKQLKKGARPLLSSENNKQVVMALREIAAGLVKPGEVESDATSGIDLLAEPALSTASAEALFAPQADATPETAAPSADPATSTETAGSDPPDSAQ